MEIADSRFDEKIHPDFRGHKEMSAVDGPSQKNPRITGEEPGLEIVPSVIETPSRDTPPPLKIPDDMEWNPITSGDKDEELPN